MENVRTLTESQEQSNLPPWTTADAPRDFIENLLGAIVGVELKVSRLDGKWKLSQNRSAADRDGVIAGLVKTGSQDALAMAAIMRGESPA